MDIHGDAEIDRGSERLQSYWRLGSGTADAQADTKSGETRPAKLVGRVAGRRLVVGCEKVEEDQDESNKKILAEADRFSQKPTDSDSFSQILTDTDSFSRKRTDSDRIAQILTDSRRN